MQIFNLNYVPDSERRVSTDHPRSKFGLHRYGIFHVERSQGLGSLSRYHRGHGYEPRLFRRFHNCLRNPFDYFNLFCFLLEGILTNEKLCKNEGIREYDQKPSQAPPQARPD